MTKDPKTIPLGELCLSNRAMNCFKAAGLRTVGDLVAMSKSELLDMPGFGRKGLNECVAMLDAFGLTLKVDTPLPRYVAFYIEASAYNVIAERAYLNRRSIEGEIAEILSREAGGDNKPSGILDRLEALEREVTALKEARDD